MKFRGLFTAIAAATLCCFTLGCPPVEDGTVPAEITVTEEAGDNSTAETVEVEDASTESTPAEGTPAESAPAEGAPAEAPSEDTPASN